ncbi:PREDICTED: pentatricopeptide repeat-containing protein At2g04860 isoform X2 [Tarenaya hassleriana]|uniref:pentatricopeptide repeat-containing protein At2g04860 isoform X2 n=1 Tax=Tarenaya hassleriana TaxID=28532 RepID=UPI00053C2A98|nr:PREDICTED: pentatricopeptide repeat-containing protein At2g04860 isoform X2 [Tarenaya hassleriana]
MRSSNLNSPASARDIFHVHGENPSSPIGIFRHLLRSGLEPNHHSISLFLKSSAAFLLSSVDSLKLQVGQIQTHLVKSGLDQFVYVKTALLDLCLKMGRVTTARLLFDEMPERDDVVWNAMICGYSRNGYDSNALQLFIEMIRQGFFPSATTLVSLLPSCGQSTFMSQGRSVHALAAKAGIGLDSQVKNALLSMYSKFGDLSSAKHLFTDMNEKTTVSWNTMIGAYAQKGFREDAILVFRQMLEVNVEISAVTIINLISAHVSHEPLHCLVVKTGIVNDSSVITSLVCAYARNGDSESAERLYESTNEESIVSLTAIISSYAEKGNMDIAVAYFCRMQRLGMELDAVAMVGILHGFTICGNINLGSSLHAYVIKSGLCADTLVANVLITMYSNFDNVEAMLILFEEINEKPLISWNSVISGCVQAGRASTAFKMFSRMKLNGGPMPDAVTIASLLTGCSQLGYLDFGKKLHGYARRNNFEMEDFVCTALIDMYAKCGNAELAESVFRSIKDPCVATWNAMISGYSLSGLHNKALSCYMEMQKQGLKPDKITFLGILAACTHGGLVDEGKKCFHAMTKEFGISPSLQHYALMVGLLGRASLFAEALDVIARMELRPDSAVWGALLNSCAMHRQIELGEYAAKKMYMLDYRNGGLYVLMSNLYAAEGMWENVAKVRRMMKDTGGDGYSGVSQIE